MKIPEEAVDAALKEWGVGGEVPRNIVTMILEAAAPHMLAHIAERLRELPFEELQSTAMPQDWPESLNVHNVINDVAAWIGATNPYEPTP